MKLPIVVYGDPVLEKKGAKIKEINDEIKQLVEDMYETMKAAPGIGLAAPQVGKSLQLAIIDLSAGENPEERIVLINPEIVEEEGLQKEEEGCLSFPGIFGFVERPERVKVKYTDIDGTEKTIEAEGLLARALCHEIDHLNGILFITKFAPVKKQLVMKKIKKLIKEGRWGY